MTEREKAIRFNQTMKAALLTVFNALNSGQQKQVLKDESVKELFNRYGVLEGYEE